MGTLKYERLLKKLEKVSPIEREEFSELLLKIIEETEERKKECQTGY